MRDRFARFGSAAAAFTSRPFNVLGNLASVAGLLLTLVVGIGLDASAIPAVYLCVLSAALIYRYVRQERSARYAEAIEVMARAVERVKEVTEHRLFGTMTREDALDRLQESLALFAEAFTLVTGVACRAAIKEVYFDEALAVTGPSGTLDFRSELWVATLARSDRSEARQIRHERPERVEENSDFKQVIATGEPFFAADLPRLWSARQYENSRWTPELEQSRAFPYRSAIVWAVEVDRPTTARPLIESGETGDDEDPVIAVLCVDSKRTNAFRRAEDVALGSLYAHALYPVLRFDRSSA